MFGSIALYVGGSSASFPVGPPPVAVVAPPPTVATIALELLPASCRPCVGRRTGAPLCCAHLRRCECPPSSSGLPSPLQLLHDPSLSSSRSSSSCTTCVSRLALGSPPCPSRSWSTEPASESPSSDSALALLSRLDSDTRRGKACIECKLMSSSPGVGGLCGSSCSSLAASSDDEPSSSSVMPRCSSRARVVRTRRRREGLDGVEGDGGVPDPTMARGPTFTTVASESVRECCMPRRRGEGWAGCEDDEPSVRGRWCR